MIFQYSYKNFIKQLNSVKRDLGMSFISFFSSVVSLTCTAGVYSAFPYLFILLKLLPKN